MKLFFSENWRAKKMSLSTKQNKKTAQILIPFMSTKWFERVLWSDESRFQLSTDSPERRLRRSDERFNSEWLSTNSESCCGGILLGGEEVYLLHLALAG